MGKPDDIVDELVHQFSDPYAFYRELIQNSIDAGSPRVDVVVRYAGGGPRGTTGGTARIEVSDSGCGMDRATIETYFLTKFRSSKSGDATKIGKFGIGFVSVFALQPERVIVDTGRAGEAWRVVLYPDHRWELYRAEEPLAGTRVTLEKEVGPDEYRELLLRSRQAVWRWCRHAEVEVRLAWGGPDGSLPRPPERVYEPFVVDAPVSVGETKGGDVIVVGPTRVQPPLCGFYKRGLTLYEAHELLVPGVTFKIMSPKLGHTLTRDDVRRDRAFDKLIARVVKLAAGPLQARVKDVLPEAARTRSPDYEALLEFARDRLAPRDLWISLAGGGAMDGRSLEKETRRFGLLVGPDDALAAAARDLGVPVVAPIAAPAAAALTRREPSDVSAVLLAAEPIEETAADAALCRALAELLAAARARTRAVRLARLHGRLDDRPFILVQEPGRAEPAESARRSPFDKKAPAILCLDCGHELVAHARRVAARSPTVAATLLCRRLAVQAGSLGLAADELLTAAALSPPKPGQVVAS